MCWSSLARKNTWAVARTHQEPRWTSTQTVLLSTREQSHREQTWQQSWVLGTGSSKSPRQGEVMEQGWSPTRESGAHGARESAENKLPTCWREMQLPCSPGQDWAPMEKLNWSPWTMVRGTGRCPLCKAIRAYWYLHKPDRLSAETLLPEAEVKSHIELLIRFRVLLHQSLSSK